MLAIWHTAGTKQPLKKNRKNFIGICFSSGHAYWPGSQNSKVGTDFSEETIFVLCCVNSCDLSEVTLVIFHPGGGGNSCDFFLKMRQLLRFYSIFIGYLARTKFDSIFATLCWLVGVLCVDIVCDAFLCSHHHNLSNKIDSLLFSFFITLNIIALIFPMFFCAVLQVRDHN